MNWGNKTLQNTFLGGLPYSLLSLIYEYDDTYRRFFQNHVLKEFQSKYPPILILKRKDGVILQYSIVPHIVPHIVSPQECNIQNIQNNQNNMRTIFSPHGPWKEFWGPHYSLSVSCRYDHGYKIGKHNTYFSSSSSSSSSFLPPLFEEKYYSKDSKDSKKSKEEKKRKSFLTGWMRQYFSHGGLLNETFRDEKGQKQGRSESRYSNGQCWTEIFYHNDKFHGSYLVYYENGVLQESMMFQDGILHGPYQKYDANGRLQVSFQYNHGKRHGKYEYWPNPSQSSYSIVSWYRFGHRFNL